MRTYSEAVALLSDMESRYKSGFTYSDRSVLDELNHQLFGKVITKTGCSDCYRDAYIHISITLKRTQEMPNPKSNYTLKAGVVLHRFGSPSFYVNPLPNDEVAEEHLALHPGEIKLFATYPVDWENRVMAYKTRQLSKTDTPGEKQNTIENAELNKLREEREQFSKEKKCLEEANARLSETVEKLNVQIEELKEVNQGKDCIDDSAPAESDEVANLLIEIETLRSDLQTANAEITTLKNDNRALKAANTRLKKSE